jgi:hypothetical protein
VPSEDAGGVRVGVGVPVVVDDASTSVANPKKMLRLFRRAWWL